MIRKKVLSADNQQGRLHHRLEPWYVSGFVDGEGSFHVAIYRDQNMKTGWKIIPEFLYHKEYRAGAFLTH